MIIHYIKILGSVMPLVLLTSCASVSVYDVKKNQPRPSHPPKVVFVSDFDALETVFRVGRKGEAFDAFRQKTISTLSSQVTERLSKNVIPVGVVTTKTQQV